MRREILMPPVTPSMTDGRVSRWHVAEGQAVSAGDLLVEVATPTATLEIEASAEGRVERILVPAGTDGVKVNTPIAILFGDPPGLASALALAAVEPKAKEARGARGGARHAGEPEEKSLTYREALRDALAEEMRADERVLVIGVDVAQNRGAPKVTQGLVDEFGRERVVSLPALDEALFGLAVGAAYAGLRPVVEITSWGRALDTLGPYLMTAAETFYLSGGKLAVPLVLRGPNGFSPGQTGEDARCVASALARIPGLKVAQPATAASARSLLQAAIRDPGPVAVLEHEQLYATRDYATRDYATPGGVAEAGGAARVGAARIARPGRDVTLVAAGHAVPVALEAAYSLALDCIDVEVVDLMWLRPLDRATVAASLARTGRLVTLEEGWRDLGIGAEIVATLAAEAFRFFKTPPLRIAGASVPMPYAAELQELALPTARRVATEIAALVRGG
ncbi:MAG: transketolase C-terminal domain-containing protein [Hyphomicrobium sp.]|uniref:transketolase C-terminal domain-containing protein n=1 Tax=Hyphomicrobium sp. TaxID=82 RepID=UPI003D11B650